MRQLEVHLKPWEARRLRQFRDRAASPRLFKRAVCLLLSAAGERAAAIAALTGMSPGTISNVRRRWRRRRLRSLDDRPRSGRPPRVTPRYRQQLRRALRTSPLDLGYVFSLWSVARLGAYLARRTGITLGRNRLRQLVHDEGFVIGRPKHTLKGRRDERAHRRTRQRLERLKRGRSERTRPSNSGTPTPRSSTSCRT